jgi:phosphoglycerate dehydrogenase-like enzyme
MKVAISYSGDFIWDESQVGRIRRRFPDVEFVEGRRGEWTRDVLEEAEVWMGFPSEEELFRMKALKWLQLPSAGADSYVRSGALPPQVNLTMASGVFGVPGAEHALALMLAFARQLHVHFRQQTQRVWRHNPHCLEIQDSTVAVIGMGDIGTEVARRAKGLGAYVIGVKRRPAARLPFVDELLTVDEMDRALERADFVVAALPLTGETEGLIGAERIAHMKRGAVFINVGRGRTVDEPALIEALASGRLEGAGLDVTAAEPPAADSPLWTMPGVILTSHAAGVSPKKAGRRAELFIANLERYLQGRPLLNAVDRTKGY